MWLWFPSDLGTLSQKTDTDVKICMTCYLTLPILGALLSFFGWSWSLGLWLAGACTLACNAYWLVLVLWIFEFRLAFKILRTFVALPAPSLEGGAQTPMQTLHLDVTARGARVARGGGSITATGAPCGFKEYMGYVHYAMTETYRYSMPLLHYTQSREWTQMLLVIMHSKKRCQVYRLLWLAVYACLNYKQLYAYGIEVRGGRYADIYSRQTMLDLALICQNGLKNVK